MSEPEGVPMIDWRKWHEAYDRPGSALARRLVVVQRFIGEALDRCPPGEIRVISMCAGEGRDILGVLPHHPRGPDVTGRLVELDPTLVASAQMRAPSRLEIVQADAGRSDAYLGATPADLLLSCGIFGNITQEDIRNTIASWRMLCRQGGFVIWTRGASKPDLRDTVRAWTQEAGFEELAFDGAPESHGVGLVRMLSEPEPLIPSHRLFDFVRERGQSTLVV